MKKMFLLAAGVLVLSGCGAATLDNGGSSETQSEEKAASELTVGVSISPSITRFLFPCKRGSINWLRKMTPMYALLMPKMILPSKAMILMI